MRNNHDKAHTSLSEKIAIRLQSISAACSITIIIIIALINMLTTMCYTSPYSVRYPYFDTMAALIGIMLAGIILYLLSHASSVIKKYRLRNVAIACILITGLLSLIWISMNMLVDQSDASEIIAYTREIFHGNANNVYAKPNAYMQRYPYQSGVALIILPLIAMSMRTSADNAYIILEYANIPLMMILVALIILIAYKIKDATAGKYAGIISTMFAPLWMGAMQVYGNIYSLPLIFTLVLLIIVIAKQNTTANTASIINNNTNANTVNTTASAHNAIIENASNVSTISNTDSTANTNTNTASADKLIKNPTSTTTSKGAGKSTTRMLILIAISIILVSFILGMIKLNNLIIGIASMITLLLIALTAWHTNRMKSIISIILAVIIIPMMFAGGTTAKFTVEKLSGIEFDESKAQPMSFFIGMGMNSESDHGNGFYLRKIGSPLAYDLKTEKAKSDETIANRREQMRTDPVGAMGFFGLKILQTWGDPTYSYGNRLGKTMFNSEADKAVVYNRPMQPLNENPSQKIINSNAFMITMRAYCDGIGIIMTLLACIGAWRVRRNPAFMLPALIVLGGFLFHIIWETQPEYAYTYALMLLPYAGIGGSECCEWLHGMHCSKSYSELTGKITGFTKHSISKNKSDKMHTTSISSDNDKDAADNASTSSSNLETSTSIAVKQLTY